MGWIDVMYELCIAKKDGGWGGAGQRRGLMGFLKIGYESGNFRP
jgi:hypothetical protein